MTNGCIGGRNKQAFVYFLNLAVIISIGYSLIYLMWVWQMTYIHEVNEDDSEVLIGAAIIMILVLPFVSLATNIALIGIWYFTFGYQMYTIYTAFGYKDVAAYL